MQVNNVPLAHVGLFSSRTSLEEATAAQFIALRNAFVEQIDENADEDANRRTIRVERATDPLSEFTGNGRSLMKLLWHLFPLQHDKIVSVDGSEKTLSFPLSARAALSTSQARHLLLQHSNVFAQCIVLVMLLADQRRRHALLHSVSIRVKHKHFRLVAELVARHDFGSMLDQAILHPKGPEAPKPCLAACMVSFLNSTVCRVAS